MNTSSENQPQQVWVETKVSSYDTLNATLIAAIIMSGSLTTILFLIWYTSIFKSAPRPTIDLAPIVDEEGDSKPEGVADDLLDPGVEEFPEIETPQLAAALESVTDAVSAVRASLEERSGSAAEMGKGGGEGSLDGGPGSGGTGVPEYKRWLIEYESEDINLYARQLTFFNIDIGLVDPKSDDITRINSPGASANVIKTNRTQESSTLRFMHQQRRMQRWDQTLAKRAGVDPKDAIMVQFYPEATRVLIRTAEAMKLQEEGKKLPDVRQTVLKVEPDGDGFKFVVVEIFYRA